MSLERVREARERLDFWKREFESSIVEAREEYTNEAIGMAAGLTPGRISQIAKERKDNGRTSKPTRTTKRAS